MAKQTGGLLGRPSGSIAGIVFGAARSRQGKIVTAREKVSPSNPNTAAQQVQRGKFGYALDIVKEIGPALYQDDWNRAVSQLPGFQSLMSIMINNIVNEDGLEDPSDVGLGNLHQPATITVATGGAANEIDVTWSTENGDNGTASDIVVAIGIAKRLYDVGVKVDTSNEILRSAGASGITLTLTDPSEEGIVGVYVRGAGTALGTLSICSWSHATIGS